MIAFPHIGHIAILVPMHFIVATTTGTAQKPEAARAAQAISEAAIERHLRALAHDSMGGREAGTPDELRAAKYVAQEYRRLGLHTGGDSNTYLQSFESAGYGKARHGIRSQNVIGCVPGDGSTKEFVVLGAHYDAQGKTATRNPPLDSVKNGALDNASGVATILSVAEALITSSAKPRRSICFIAFGAEESGLLGSRAYIHALTDTASVVAMLNIDGANLWGMTEDIAVLGDDYSTLGEDFRQAAAAESLWVTVHEREIREGFFGRSDQSSFANAGIPALFFRRGKYLIEGGAELWEQRWADYYGGGRYHGYTDEILDWHSMAGAAQQARVAVRVLLDVADASERPTWNEESQFRKRWKERMKRRKQERMGGGRQDSGTQ